MKIKAIVLGVGGLLVLAAGIFVWANFKNIQTLGKAEIVQVTAQVLPRPKDKPDEQVQPVKLLAFGDLLLDRYIKKSIDKYGADYPFTNIKTILAGNDLVLANLEGSFTDFKPYKAGPNMASFTFDPRLAPEIQKLGFNIMTLANNHVRDFGATGFSQSQGYLDQAGIARFGDYYNQEPALIQEINGIKLVFIGYNEFGDPLTSGAVAKIKTARGQADFIIVYAHWGNEYQTNFSTSQQTKARQLIDAGADIVLGSHPHVIQPIEIYKNKPIFYSLGNFVFDQIFSFDVTHGLGVRFTLDKNKMEIELILTELKNFQVGLTDDKTKTAILKKIATKSIVDETIKQQIATGNFSLEQATP